MWTYRPQLDGLRTVAIYLVLLYHAGLSWFAGGFIGVDVFFVLSGFLVANVILAEIGEHGRLDLGGFYARRVRRLLPAAVVVVVVTCIVFVAIASVVRRLPLAGDATAALLYFANWHFMAQSNDYFAQDLAPSPFVHFWSLAIEEQFYLVFPILLAFLHRRFASGGKRRQTGVGGIVAVLALLALVSIVLQIVVAAGDVNRAYYGTDTRLYQLLAGAILAVLLRDRPALVPPKLAGNGLWLGAAGLVVFGSGLLDISPSWRGLAACALTVAVVLGLMQRPEDIVTRTLSRPTWVYLGKISYGTYLWHWPVIVAMNEILDLGPGWCAFLATGLSTGLAAISFQLLETPIRRSKRWSGLPWRTAGVGLATSLVLGLVVVSPLVTQERAPAITAASAGGGEISGVAEKAQKVKIPQDIDWEKAFADRGRAPHCTGSDLDPCIAVRNDGPTVLLVGDSYASMFFPMLKKLAEEKGFTLASQVVRGCPWVEGLEDLGAPPESRAECEEMRVGWYDEVMPDLDPDLVLTVQRPRDTDPSWNTRVQARNGDENVPLKQLTFETMQATVAKLSKLVPRVLLIQSVVSLGEGANDVLPLDCLSKAKTAGDCAELWDGQTPPSDSYMEAEAVATDNVYTTSLNPVVCPHAPLCLSYLDNEIVWRDGLHLMTTFAIAKRNEIWAQIEKSGALKGLNFDTRND